MIKEKNWNKKSLWNGCILASIAHAIRILKSPIFAYEHSWDGNNYSLQDSAGTRGTISFSSDFCTAAFRNEKSKRLFNYSQFINSYLKKGCFPKKIEQSMNHITFQYLLDNIDNFLQPVITTLFWCDKSYLYSFDNFNEMMENGGFILRNHIMDIENAFLAWEEEFEMNANQVKLLKKIYNIKTQNPFDKIIISKSEIDLLGEYDEEGFSECRSCLNEINIDWEDE